MTLHTSDLTIHMGTCVVQSDLTQRPTYYSILGFTLVIMQKVLTAISVMLLCTLPVVPMGGSNCNDSKTSVHFTLLASNIKLADARLWTVVDAITYVIAFLAHFSVTVSLNFELMGFSVLCHQFSLHQTYRSSTHWISRGVWYNSSQKVIWIE